MKQGWECPKCKAVMSPAVGTCFYCKPISVQDLNKCPGCGGPADNGHDRCYPPNPYYCKRCNETPNAIAQGREHSERPAGAEG